MQSCRGQCLLQYQHCSNLKKSPEGQETLSGVKQGYISALLACRQRIRHRTSPCHGRQVEKLQRAVMLHPCMGMVAKIGATSLELQNLYQAVSVMEKIYSRLPCSTGAGDHWRKPGLNKQKQVLFPVWMTDLSNTFSGDAEDAKILAGFRKKKEQVLGRTIHYGSLNRAAKWGSENLLNQNSLEVGRVLKVKKNHTYLFCFHFSLRLTVGEKFLG